MSEPQISPFVPGARVAITDGWDNWHEGFVEKVHKSGRFTLRGGNGRQWKPITPSHYGNSHWRGFKTGNAGYSRTSLRIWDASADTEIKEIFAAQARKQRWLGIRRTIEHVRDGELTDAMLDQIEAALPASKKETSGDRPADAMNLK